MNRVTFSDYDDQLMQVIEERQESLVAEHCQGLLALDRWADGMFCLACCERVIPNYVAFAKSINSPGGEVLRGLLDHAWRAQANGMLERPTQKDLNSLSFVLDDFQIELAIYAADAICVFDLAFDDSTHTQKRNACDAAASVLNDTSKYLMNSFCHAGMLLRDVEKSLFSHPLWTRELEIQRKIVELLVGKEMQVSERIAAVQAVAKNGGISNIGMRHQQSK